MEFTNVIPTDPLRTNKDMYSLRKFPKEVNLRLKI